MSIGTTEVSPETGPRGLRACVLALALASSTNIKAISRRIGHAQTGLTMDIYAHVLPEQHREVADEVSAIFFGNAPAGKL